MSRRVGTGPMETRPAFGVVQLFLDKYSPFRNPRPVPPEGASFVPDDDGLTGWVTDGIGSRHRVAMGCWHSTGETGACRLNCKQWKARLRAHDEKSEAVA